jgi:hypothetical protein
VTQIDERLREMFLRRAEDPPPHSTVPPSLGRRARRRIALNAVGVGALVVVLAAGATIGVRAILGQATVGPADQTTAPPVQRTTSSSTNPVCTVDDLRANGTLLGAAGSLEGAIDLSNYSDHTCTLKGRPSIVLLNQHLRPIQSGINYIAALPGWKADAAPKPAGWPVVTLKPGKAASSRIRWGNWCPQGRAAPLWQVRLPDGETVDVKNGMEGLSPPCNGPGQPSTIEVGPFEPERQP